MSTNAIITILERGNPAPLVTIWKHWDGGPEDLGVEIKTILIDPVAESAGAGVGSFNGPGDAAAFLVSQLKKEKRGDVYLMQPGMEGAAFDYRVYFKNNQPTEMDITHLGPDGAPVLDYRGTLVDFDPHKLEGCR